MSNEPLFKPSDITVTSWSRDEFKTGMIAGTRHGIKIVHDKTGITVTYDEHRYQHENRYEALLLLNHILSESIKPSHSDKG